MRKLIQASLALCVAGLLSSCGKKADEAPAAEAAADPAAPAAAAAAGAPAEKEVLPGANSVREAFAKKQYETAVGGLLALRGAATVSPLTEEYMKLYDELKFGLMEAAETDPKAAQALAMMRAASAGR